jgi:hypothetical protein
MVGNDGALGGSDVERHRARSRVPDRGVIVIMTMGQIWHGCCLKEDRN